MPRGTTLSTLLSMLKAAIGDNATGNTTRDTELTTLLSNEQKLYASSYDFGFLEHRWDLSCASGSRFLSLPTATSATGDIGAVTLAINFDRPVKVETKFNGIWLPLSYNINSKEYNTFDSDASVTSDPIQKWRFATNTAEAANSDKIEIWPMPTTAQTVRFTGQRTLVALSTGTDKADLDDMLLVYSVAVKKAIRSDLLEEAKLHLAQAKQRELQVRANYPQEEPYIIVGDGCYREKRKLVPLVVAA